MTKTTKVGGRAGVSRTAAIIVAVVVVIVVVGAAVGVYYYTRPSPKVSQVTFYTWWGGPDGGPAVSALEAAFHQAYPSLQVQTELKPGAGGINAKGAILALIEAGNPPMTFQSHSGPEMISYVEAAPSHVKSFVNTTSYLDSLKNVIPEVIWAAQYNGTSFLFPVNMHRGALLFINPNALYEAGISTLPQNVSQLMADAKILYQHFGPSGGGGVTIPGGDGGWDQMQWWEDLFLANSIAATGSSMFYDELMYGTLNLSDPVVAEVVNETNTEYLTLLSYNMPGIGSLSWDSSVLNSLLQGKTGFFANGNWVTNTLAQFFNTTVYYENSTTMSTAWDHEHNINMIEMPFPGTQGYYALVSDAVAVPVGPDTSYGLMFAKFFSSFEGQKAFTYYKAVTFYSNVTSPSFYQEPAQWGDYQAALSLIGQPSHWVYQLSDGGLFDEVFTAFTTDLESFTSPSGVSTWNQQLQSLIQQEKSDWLAAVPYGLGFIGSYAHPFGGYLPPWAKAPSAVHSTTQTGYGGYLPAFLGLPEKQLAIVLRLL